MFRKILAKKTKILLRILFIIVPLPEYKKITTITAITMAAIELVQNAILIEKGYAEDISTTDLLFSC